MVLNVIVVIWLLLLEMMDKVDDDDGDFLNEIIVVVDYDMYNYVMRLMSLDPLKSCRIV